MRIGLRFAVVAGVAVLAACSEEDSPSQEGRADAGSEAAGAGGQPRGGGGGGGGQPRQAAGVTAFVAFNVPPDQDCNFELDAGIFLLAGNYDLAAGSDPGGACASPYTLHLIAQAGFEPPSALAGEEGILQLHTANVRLMTAERVPLEFDGGSAALPNPFLSTVAQSMSFPGDGELGRAIAPVEAIPLAYARALRPMTAMIGEQILAEVTLFGTTTTDVDVEFQPFVYPIELCFDCLRSCLSVLEQQGIDPDDVSSDECRDNMAVDGRVCVDPDC